MSLSLQNPVQPVIEIPPDSAAWQRCESVADTAARWRIYLHQLAIASLLEWFRSELDTVPRPWPEVAPFDIWHVVDGLSIAFGSRRVVVILSEAIDSAVLEMPQEWVDIPDWAAHYYIAAQIDVDEQRLALWGYTTHARIKAQAAYDADERLYCVKDSDLIQDFAVFGAMQSLEAQAVQEESPADLAVEDQQDRPVAVSTAPMSDRQAEQLVQRLARLPEPRLEIPFDQWSQLLRDRSWRRQLYQQRQGSPPVNLGRWFDQIFDQGWAALDTLRAPGTAFSFRSAPGSSGLLEHSATSKTPRTMPIVRSKSISLAQAELTLVLSLSTAPDGRSKIRIQLHPAETECLPGGLILALERAETEEILLTIQAGAQDNYTQLPGFNCSSERSFRVRVQLGDQAIYEEFIS